MASSCSTTGHVWFMIMIFVSVLGDGDGVVVSKDGSGDYDTISKAIAKAPNLSKEAYTIYVRAGTYKEFVTVPPHKTNIVLIGHSPQTTKIVAPANTKGTTIDIYGAGFMAQNMAFVNSADLNASAAVAVRNEADHSVFFQCSIEGFQDTLWAVSGRQFYKNCDIYGTVDFVYGNAAAVFQDCSLFARYREYVTFTAQSREKASERTGFTFQRCKFTISPEEWHRMSQVHATLGRPWRPYSTVAIMDSYIDSIVDSKGWEEMPGQPIDKVTFVEFNNKGPGSNTSGRVNWTGVRLLTHLNQAMPFTASTLLDADSWIPKKGVPYDSGF
ncbi:hypothetical protein L6164_004604 [Bauhinia variegata]|uniref:Uncharacterized protein n=1 Tax=Bauhinia variegata TaxID=167791 RepID=A0ACB9Q5L4_BAUVA|nr:hypothetical protein L6164_004604 [Bauhinia variegata]